MGRGSLRRPAAALPLALLLAALGPAVVLSGPAAAPSAPADRPGPPSLDTDPHLAGWWKFDDASGTAAADSSGHGRGGALEGGLSFEKSSAPGRLGKALRFDGKGGYVRIAGYKGVTGTAPRTVAAWIRTAAPKGELVSWGLDDAGRMWILGFIRSRVGVTPRGGYLYMDAALSDDAWHHAAAVVAEAKPPNLHDHVRLYADGAPARIHDIGLLDLWPIDTGGELEVRIGRNFSGLLDDVRIYDRALSQDEVKTLAAGGAAAGGEAAGGAAK